MATKKTAIQETATDTENTSKVSEAAKTVSTEEKRYLKSSILKFGKYVRWRDLLAIILKDGEKYTLSEVDKLLKKEGKDD